MKPFVLCILDGVGIKKEKYGNAVKQANMPNFNKLLKIYPHSLLEASGNAVGLPHGQMGNSEVGHSNIGAGRVLYQPQEIINREIKTGKFYQNKKILEVINHVKNNNSKLHIFGLLSDGGIHSDISHLMALIDMCKDNDIKNLYFHIFLDGRDTLPTESIKYIEELEQKIKETNIGSIATISGRYYAMDRDNRWDRIEKAYNVIIGKGNITSDYKEYIKESYKKNITDEFIEPILVDKNGTLDDNDGLIVFNFRPDRLRELFKAITNKNFNEFEHKNFKNIKLVTMFGVSEEVICTNAYQKDNLENTLGIYLSKNNLKQLRIAETEKYAHVTYFFDGGKELELKGKDQILIPSPKVSTYDLKPEMSAYEITDKLIEVIDKYDVIILNFANGDMVGHTGKFNETIKALETIDECIGKIYKKVTELNGTLMITADHGNSDTMLDKNNNLVTSHSTSKVPLIITDKKIKLKNGKLADVAPTILSYLKLKVPKEMTGKNLIKKNTISNIFIILSLIFILTFSCIYITRFIKYYKEENNNVDEIILVNELKNNIVTNGDGLYYQNREYIFKGYPTNNYLEYSGILFRIIKINEDNSIKLITENSVANLKYDGNYKTSDIKSYLNDNGLEHTGIFYNNLINNTEYLKVDNDINEKIGLLTYKEYVDALGNKSYLNNNSYFWLIDGEYVFNEGGISSENKGYYGIRPVITLKENTKLLSGNGTKEDPYKIENNNVTIGKYIEYSNLLWKIIEVNEDSYKLALSSSLNVEYIFSNKSNQFNPKEYGSIANYLNNQFYNKLDKKYLLKGTFYTGEYNNNYLTIYDNSLESYVGLLSVIDNYVNDFTGYNLITPSTADMIYQVGENNKLIINSIENKSKVRPVIYISKEANIIGNGIEESPFVVE
mgnify:FL=1